MSAWVPWAPSLLRSQGTNQENPSVDTDAPVGGKPSGQTALRMAAYDGQAEMCEALLRRMSADAPMLADSKRNTALHCAAAQGHSEATRVLAMRWYGNRAMLDATSVRECLHNRMFDSSLPLLLTRRCPCHTCRQLCRNMNLCGHHS